MRIWRTGRDRTPRKRNFLGVPHPFPGVRCNQVSHNHLLDFGEYFIVITQHTVAFGIKAVSYLEADHLTLIFEGGDFKNFKNILETDLDQNNHTWT